MSAADPSRNASSRASLVVDLGAQTLTLYQNAQAVRTFEVSTALRGAGQQTGSYQTPLGAHVIRAAIGAGQPEGAVFTARRPTGELWTPQLHREFPGRDWILTRILWLSGTERGFNRLGNVDTMRRYIYLHGTPDCEPMGTPGSHGCIRMRNADIVWLFDHVVPGTPVQIEAGKEGRLEVAVRPEAVPAIGESTGSLTPDDERSPTASGAVAAGSSGAEITHAQEAAQMTIARTFESHAFSRLAGSGTLGPIMVDVAATQLDAGDREVLAHPLTGGVILFSRNYADRSQLRKLVQDIRSVNPELIVAVDQEGGRVQRFREGFTAFPPMRTFGELYNSTPDIAIQRAEDCGWVLGQELAEMDIDLTFAPVVDLDYGVSLVIGDRAFAPDPEVVVALAGAFLGGLHSAGLASCIKHFPGHGFVTADSHHELPVDARSREQFEPDLLPFGKLALRARAVMTAHLLAPCEDDRPVSFSSRWVNGVLRQELGFRGVVFSDDLSMKGADCDGGVRAKVEQALAAGCQFLPICNDRDAVLELYAQPLEVARSTALGSLRRHLAPSIEVKATKRYQHFQTFISRLENPADGR